MDRPDSGDVRRRGRTARATVAGDASPRTEAGDRNRAEARRAGREPAVFPAASPAVSPAASPAASPADGPRRPACVDVPALPLQLLLRRHPEWDGHPVAVVARDEPQGLVLQVNEEARRRRVLPGQRFAAALALADDLRAGVVPEAEVRRGVDETADRLRRFTPGVEPSRDEPGVFWLDASGLGLLHPDLRRWAAAVRADLASAGLRSCVAVGFTRFGAYAVARALASRLLPADAGGSAAQAATRGPPPAPAVVFLDEDAERRALRRVPLDRLGIAPAVRDLLGRLGVRTVEQFVALPAAGLGERFGEEVHRLHRLAAGDARDPLAPESAREPVRASVLLEHPETDGARLLFLVKRLLDPLLFRTAERREAVAGIELRLRLDVPDGSPHDAERAESLRPASPTLDSVQLLDLVRLRLESMRLAHGATEVVLTAEGVPAAPAQLDLFAEKPRRDLAAADRALARLRAEFGDGAVVRARLRDAHLPEASFAWEPLEHVQAPRVRAVSRAPLVRRLLARPVPLPPRPRHEPDGWMLRGLEHGNVVRLEGPFVVSGGWWAGEGTRREYHFAETSKGRVFWVFYDVRRRRWFLQGEVS